MQIVKFILKNCIYVLNCPKGFIKSFTKENTWGQYEENIFEI